MRDFPTQVKDLCATAKTKRPVLKIIQHVLSKEIRILNDEEIVMFGTRIVRPKSLPQIQDLGNQLTISIALATGAHVMRVQKTGINEYFILVEPAKYPCFYRIFSRESVGIEMHGELQLPSRSGDRAIPIDSSEKLRAYLKPDYQSMPHGIGEYLGIKEGSTEISDLYT